MIIYCASVVYATPTRDGKKKLKNEIQHYAKKEDAIRYVDETEKWCERSCAVFKFGRVFMVTEVIE